MEPLLEYQDYLLAYRLRVLIGGGFKPTSPLLPLARYARKRIERQQLAQDLLGKNDYQRQMRRVDELTDELNFGFWHNPNETIKVLRRVIEGGGCKALESRALFIANLLTEQEKARLSAEEQDLIASYYLGLCQASAAYLDAEVFTRLRDEVEPLREALPVFVMPESQTVS